MKKKEVLIHYYYYLSILNYKEVGGFGIVSDKIEIVLKINHDGEVNR